MKSIFSFRVFVYLFAVSVFTACGSTQTEGDMSQAPPGNEDVTDPLSELKMGNQRFIEDHTVHPHQTLSRLRSLKSGQHPVATVVSCSDSRVPPELIFDQGLGDLFVIRNAGNILGDYELGSVEYAVTHLHTPIVIVLGHEGCGAIEAFVSHKHDTIPNHIQDIIDYIKSEPEEQVLDDSAPDYLDLAVEANVRHGVNYLQQSDSVLVKALRNGEVRVIGAVFDMDTGLVRWLE
jgi:carbonic anhydrase